MKQELSGTNTQKTEDISRPTLLFVALNYNVPFFSPLMSFGLANMVSLSAVNGRLSLAAIWCHQNPKLASIQ